MEIALGVSGGIAAYKACEIVRGLTKAGADVRVLMTRNATRFIAPLTLETLSGRPVFVDAFGGRGEQAVRHIELTKTLSALVVAPATANILAKFARGIADDLLSTFYTAVVAPVVVAPAMNTRMWLHPETQENVDRLRARGVGVVDPEAGWLAEREEGWGRLADPSAIVEAALRAARRSTSLAGRTVLVTAGPTREAIDPVRYVSNRSSGKMGFALAAAARRRGARVILVSGPVDRPTPYGVERIDVVTAEEMREAVFAHRAGTDAILMAAAVADYVPRAEAQKIKKGDGPLTLTLDRGPDVLAELGSSRAGEVLVGFAAETTELIAHAETKLKAKNLDFIVANDVSGAETGFDADDNAVTVLARDGSRRTLPRASKTEIAEQLLDHLLEGLR